MLLFLALSFAFYASSAHAQFDPGSFIDTDLERQAEGGLVPCGGPGDPCEPCDFMVLANNAVRFAFKFIILPLVALGILASGLILLTAGGSQTQIEKGKSMLWNILIGFFIAVSAWLIISTILGTLVVGGFGYNPLTETFPVCK